MDLETAYLQTKYLVFLKSRKKVATLEIGKMPPKSFTKFLQKKKFTTFAYLTPCNPCSVLLSKRDNKTRIYELIDELSFSPYLFGKTKSLDKKWDEISFCLLGISFEEARNIAFLSSQTAFLYGSIDSKVELHWTLGKQGV